MSELSFEQMLEESLKTIRTGDIVEGTIIDVKPDEIVLNIGYKSDGIIARKRGLVTDFGKVMDPLSDKTLVFAAYLVFINMGWHTELCILLMLAREFLVAGIRMLAATNGEVIAANAFGKCKTFLQMSTTGMTFLLLAIGEGAADITTSTHWLNVYCAIAFWIVSVITVLSGLIYAKDGWYLIKTK